MPLDFVPDTLPWLDRANPDVAAYARAQGDPALEALLAHWVKFGFIRMPGLIDHALIDAYLEDMESVLSQPERTRVRMLVEGYGVRQACDLPPEAFAQHHLRIMDLHNLSQAGKQLSLHPRIVGFLQHVFQDTVVAMQSLSFKHSTEQGTHQDFPYVQSRIPSHLAATWIALEDVHPDAGPLFYYPGSHRLEKFDWGEGILMTPGCPRNEQEFARFLEEKCAAAGLQREVFYPKKGDVFFWHAALVHGGSVVNNPALTRKSYVTHYSSQTAYPSDRRAPRRAPFGYAINGGLVYQDPICPEEEDRLPYPRAASAAPLVLDKIDNAIVKKVKRLFR
ncbi:phytanoyl-CoA dioxygenase family protein [Massilia sp. TS11]|uniref:phytanoyl-CoA dioxygenase family protein n=1 Tax=Massilia sp. TS11 TaxID=2908003 RepID=UPI001EDBB2A8|nr:phytanoyl-CoA dioxygenase family protein [Massilia sp. TS11]MCG2584326.1 phytanoyl-CoA dioxygenase family protein [Massilia sp. TS11]